MSHMLYQILKVYVILSIRFYFNRREERGKEHLEGNGPFLFVANHQNAFMDGLLIVILNSFPVHFLIRADIFKSSFARAVLKFLKLMPVYRIRDGYSSLGKNQQQFDACVRLFTKKASVLVFPEGNHGWTRRLRPLSKGFTRIAFEANRQHPEMNLKIIPVGINYSHYKAFNSRVSVRYGSAIPVTDFFKEPLPQMANELKDLVGDEIEKRITHIADTERYDEILKKLEDSNTDFFNPEEANERIKKVVHGEPIPNLERKPPLYYTLTTPLRPLAWLVNYPLLLGWSWFSKKIKDPVFTISMKYGFGLMVGSIYYFTLMGISSIWLGWWAAAVYPLLLCTLKILRKPI
jgi:1-acyl-sn-glycerol-3-phosphate acyltransferase